MWHTDFKLLDDGRWFLCYKDDASRFVTGYGAFEHATMENALVVLKEAIKNHDKRHDPQLRIEPSMPIILQMCAPKHATFV